MTFLVGPCYNVIIKDEVITVPNPDEASFSSCEDIQKSRIKVLQKQCQKLLLEKEKLGPIKSQFFDDPPNPKMNNVYVNHPRKLSICIPHKVGTDGLFHARITTYTLNIISA